jgi:DNA-binding transcriptional regulator GbsR (MarR family)
MNYMNKQTKSVRKKKTGSGHSALIELARAVGDFIRYWGFRRIHGEIWTHLFLSQTPLSGADLVKKLKVSKALISPAIRQLERYQLITKVASADPRVKKYIAESDYKAVIKSILIKRELPMLSEIQNLFHELQIQTKNDPVTSADINKTRLIELQNFTMQANLLVGALISLKELNDISTLANSSQHNSQNSNNSTSKENGV